MSAQTTQTNTLLDINDVIVLTKLSRPNIYRKMRAGEIPAVKVGRRRLFRSLDIQAWISDLPVVV